MKRSATTVFGDWAENGQDERMAKGHEIAVSNMLDAVLTRQDSYRFIDAGCGNGWVVRLVNKEPNCKSALGVDGSKRMIEKAQRIDPKGAYLHADLMSWTPEKRADIVHSMEVIYYLPNPKEFIQSVYTNWLAKNGRLIVGLDFYMENSSSHSWPDDCGISMMHLLGEKEWVSLFEDAGFNSIKTWRVEPRENWAGTLVITGLKD